MAQMRKLRPGEGGGTVFAKIRGAVLDSKILALCIRHPKEQAE